jgi:hypothetical protein
VSPVKYELGFYIPQDDILHCKLWIKMAFNMVARTSWLLSSHHLGPLGAASPQRLKLQPVICQFAVSCVGGLPASRVTVPVTSNAMKRKHVDI